ncbi:hypothetical protein INR49_006863 [Caranx melampygus]|nr:hypothetical protein INR49_006863 [Caranx melampygus]
MERRQSLEEQLRCPVCLDVFTEPLMLQCGHSYCRCCVRSMTLDLLGQLQCPVCRCAVDGDSPPPNVSLARIIEALQEVSVSGGAQLESCPQHHNPLSLYCEDEQTVICGLCGSIGAHRGHKITPVSSVYSRMKNESDVLKWVVRKEFGELRRCLEVEEAGFMQQVETSTAVLISSLQNQTDHLNQNLSRLQDAHNTLQDLSNEGHLDFIMKYGSIAPRFRESQELHQREERLFSSITFRPGFNHNDIKLTVWKRLHRKVEVGNKPKWRLGLIRGTTSRKAKLVKSPESGVWLIGLKDGVYEAFASPRVVLPVSVPPRRVGLFLDYEGGGLTFYNSDSSDELGFIYSFRLEVQGKSTPCWTSAGMIEETTNSPLSSPGLTGSTPSPSPLTSARDWTSVSHGC